MAKSKGMTREEAAELYQDLRKVMGTMKAGKGKKPQNGDPEMQDIAKSIAASISQSMSKDTKTVTRGRPVASSARPKSAPIESLAAEEAADAVLRMRVEEATHKRSGPRAAVMFVLLVAACKVGISVLEASGFVSVPTAFASLSKLSVTAPEAVIAPAPRNPSFSKEEIHVLTSLDHRRVELEERSKKIDDREADLANREKTFAAKLTQLRELTDQIKGEREKNEKKRNVQLDQLANVYGSMAPQEAANLMEQLDVTIALSLLERMPEKRIGQILALMHPERALAMTRMLSGKAGQ